MTASSPYGRRLLVLLALLLGGAAFFLLSGGTTGPLAERLGLRPISDERVTGVSSKPPREGWASRPRTVEDHALDLHMRAWEVNTLDLAEAFHEYDPFARRPFSTPLRLALINEGISFPPGTHIEAWGEVPGPGYVIARHTRGNLEHIRSYLQTLGSISPLVLKTELFKAKGWERDRLDSLELEVRKALRVILDEVVIEEGTRFGDALDSLEDQIAAALAASDDQALQYLNLRIEEPPGDDGKYGLQAALENSPTDEIRLRSVPVVTVLQYLTAKRKICYWVDGSGVTYSMIGFGGPAPPEAQRWHVAPALIDLLRLEKTHAFHAQDPFSDEFDPFTADALSPEDLAALSLQEILVLNGISFPDGAEAIYSEERAELLLVNTPPNLDLAKFLFTELMIQESMADWQSGDQ